MKTEIHKRIYIEKKNDKKSMVSEKLENLLHMSLTVEENERLRSDALRIGYSPEEKSWEVIVKYHGDLQQYESERINIELLIAGYAIVSLPESDLEWFTELPQVEYIEKPKAFYANVYRAKEASCILPVTTGRSPVLSGEGLRGSGVLIAVIDSGIDFYREDFIGKNGSRILFLWDQELDAEYTKADMDRAINSDEGNGIRHQDVTGHGTAVAGIAAGSSSNPLYQGVASEAEFIVVKLGQADSSGFPGTVELMRGITYAVKKAMELEMPLVINLSYGNSYGSHEGTSLLERFLDNAGEMGRTVVCVGSGNEGDAAGHVGGNVLSENKVELAIGEYETSVNVQLWKRYADRIELSLTAPDGKTYGINLSTDGLQTIDTDYEKVLVFVGTPLPYDVNQEIFFVFLPKGAFLTSGIWNIGMQPERVVNGEYQMYLPGREVRSEDTRFLQSNPYGTLTIPSTAQKVVTVGAYDVRQNSYADFSGRGYPFFSADAYLYLGQKPDIVAPGVDILAPFGREEYLPVTGTSFATPIVAGSCALLMEWGIIRGNDPYLYGEKIKAYLQRGAKQFGGFPLWPNPYVGWGKLCLEDSLP